jgi:hypothetical protein
MHKFKQWQENTNKQITMHKMQNANNAAAAKCAYCSGCKM